MRVSIVLFWCVCFVAVFTFVECKGGGKGFSGSFKGLFGGSRSSSSRSSVSSFSSPSISSNYDYGNLRTPSNNNGKIGFKEVSSGTNYYNPVSYSDVKYTLPSKAEVDRMVDSLFKSQSFSEPHEPKLINTGKLGFEGITSGNIHGSLPNNIKSPSNNGKIGFEELTSGTNYHRNPIKNDVKDVKLLPSNEEGNRFTKNLLNNYGSSKPFDQPILINSGNIGFDGVNTGVNYHKNDLWKMGPKTQNRYTPWSHYPRRYYVGNNNYHYSHPRNYYRNYNSGSSFNSGNNSGYSLYNPCLYYGGFNNNPLMNNTDKSSVMTIPSYYCENNGQNIGALKNKLNGPGFGMGLLGGAATGMSLGVLLGMGLDSLGSTPWNHNNEAFNEWLKHRVQQDPAKLKSTDETLIISGVLNETRMCPGEANILDAAVLNTLVPCNVTNIVFNEADITEPNFDECKWLTMSIIQVNANKNENKTLNINIKQNNMTGSKLFEDLSYDIYISSCVRSLKTSGFISCKYKTFKADSYAILNETVSYFEGVNITITQYNTTVNNSCADLKQCNSDHKNVTSTYINWSILPKHPLHVVMSQCVLIKNNLCESSSSSTICDDSSSNYTKQNIGTDTFLTSEDFANINILMHQSSYLLNYREDIPVERNEDILTSTTKSSVDEEKIWL